MFSVMSGVTTRNVEHFKISQSFDPEVFLALKLASSKQSANVSMYMPKMIGDRGIALLESYITMNFFQPSLNVPKIGNKFFIQPYQNDPQL
jgi:hypothetical protein